MRTKALLTGLAVVLGGLAMSPPVKAVDFIVGLTGHPDDRRREPHHLVDPYGYHYEPRGYYPYYSSHYWKPARRSPKRPYLLPPYYQAWGYPLHRNHREWQYRHHGRIRPWHW